jgi:hypothetical protein
MMEAARTSEMSVDNYFTLQYIPEDKSELQSFFKICNFYLIFWVVNILGEIYKFQAFK